MENQKQSVGGLKEWFEANYLDGDKIQDGQTLSSQECFEALSQQQLEVVEMIKKTLPAYRKQERTDNLESDWYENGGFNDCLREVLQSLSTLNINK